MIDPILVSILSLAALGMGGAFLYFKFGRRVQTKLAGGWLLDTYSTNVKLNEGGGLFSFAFPNAYPGVHKITKTVNGLPLGESITVHYDIIGSNAKFVAAGDTPQMGLVIDAGRIYSNQPYLADLKLGSGQTLIVPLKPECWETVDGFPCNHDAGHIERFEKAVKQALAIGVCFGDDHGRGHGAYLTKDGGSATFKLTSFKP